jgi:RimJ/RimL family protein N-acetyltransferase
MNIKTPRLYLRPFTPDDRDFIRELDSDPEVMLHLTNGVPSDENEIDRAMSVFLKFQNLHNGRYGYWMACLITTNDPIGWFHLRPLKKFPDDLSTLELGYRLKKEYWSQGFASEMSVVLCNYAFNDLAAERICAHTMKSNFASQAVMKKVGMSLWYEDTFDQFPSEDKSAVWFKKDKTEKVT